jgi:hypothetical protein
VVGTFAASGAQAGTPRVVRGTAVTLSPTRSFVIPRRRDREPPDAVAVGGPYVAVAEGSLVNRGCPPLDLWHTATGAIRTLRPAAPDPDCAGGPDGIGRVWVAVGRSQLAYTLEEITPYMEGAGAGSVDSAVYLLELGTSRYPARILNASFTTGPDLTDERYGQLFSDGKWVIAPRFRVDNSGGSQMLETHVYEFGSGKGVTWSLKVGIVLAANRGRILTRRKQRLILLRVHGEHLWSAPQRGPAALEGRFVVAVHRGVISVYDARTGHRRTRRRICQPHEFGGLYGLQGGLVAYRAQRGIHLLRLANMRDVVARFPLRATRVWLSPTGLVYFDGKKRFGFVPRARLLSALGHT